MVNEGLLSALREIMVTPKPWVLFKHHSVVIIEEEKEGETLQEQATEIMKKMGPVMAGCEHGDFNTITAKNDLGWIVTSHCPVLYTYVSPEEVKKEEANDLVVGLFGRGKRHEDSQDPQVIHVEAKND